MNVLSPAYKVPTYYNSHQYTTETTVNFQRIIAEPLYRKGKLIKDKQKRLEKCQQIIRKRSILAGVTGGLTSQILGVNSLISAGVIVNLNRSIAKCYGLNSMNTDMILILLTQIIGPFSVAAVVNNVLGPMPVVGNIVTAGNTIALFKLIGNAITWVYEFIYENFIEDSTNDSSNLGYSRPIHLTEEQKKEIYDIIKKNMNKLANNK